MARADLFDLEGRVAIVTGASGLLGPQHVEALTSFGAKVVAADVIRKDVGDFFVRTDVTSRASVTAMVRRVLKRYGRIDILVNNAAAQSKNFFAPFEGFPVEDWNRVMAVNLTGVFLCAQAAGVPMVRRRHGSMINIASIYGVVGPDQRIYKGSRYRGRPINTPAVYSASKGGVIGVTRYLATYWAKAGIRVNALTPGGVYTGQNETFVRRYSDRTPLGRMAHLTDLQGALVYLASDASSYVTGQNLIVDGGWTAW